MAKGTIILLFCLSIIAVFLFGVNFGKKLNSPITDNLQLITVSPTANYPSLTAFPTISSGTSSAITVTSKPKVTGTGTYTDKTCGFSFSYPGSYVRQTTSNEQSFIFSDPDDPNLAIAIACLSEIPRPPVSSDKIEATTIDGRAAMLYHDQSAKDGSPRDEVIVKHPKSGKEIIIAGYGENFHQVLTSFKFIQ